MTMEANTYTLAAYCIGHETVNNKKYSLLQNREIVLNSF